MDQKAATKKRFTILSMVFFTVVINYLDRSNISVPAPVLREELGLNTIQMGYVFSAFGWTYALLQIPGGIIADKIKVKTVDRNIVCRK